MPLVGSGLGTQVFDTTEDVLNFARVLCNDAQSTLAGQILADNQPYTWTLLNFVYRRLANWLEDSNVESATYEENIVSVPASENVSDPNGQCCLDYTGFTDAGGNFYESPTLPEMVQPLTLWQKPTGVMQPFQEMRQQLGGLDSGYSSGYLGRWEFRQNGIYFAGGNIQPTDLRIRSIPSFPTLTQPVAGQPAPSIYFARAGQAFAYMLAAEYQEIRNAPNAPLLRAKANMELETLANKSAKRANNSQTRARGYGFGGSRRRGAFRVYG